MTAQSVGLYFSLPLFFLSFLTSLEARSEISLDLPGRLSPVQDFQVEWERMPDILIQVQALDAIVQENQENQDDYLTVTGGEYQIGVRYPLLSSILAVQFLLQKRESHYERQSIARSSQSRFFTRSEIYLDGYAFQTSLFWQFIANMQLAWRVNGNWLDQRFESFFFREEHEFRYWESHWTLSGKGRESFFWNLVYQPGVRVASPSFRIERPKSLNLQGGYRFDHWLWIVWFDYRWYDLLNPKDRNTVNPGVGVEHRFHSKLQWSTAIDLQPSYHRESRDMRSNSITLWGSRLGVDWKAYHDAIVSFQIRLNSGTGSGAQKSVDYNSQRIEIHFDYQL